MMRILFLLLFVFSFQLQGRCDTIPNWQVFYKGELLAQFNANQSKFSVVLPKENRKDTDVIKVIYRQTGQCLNCRHNFIIEDVESDRQWTDSGDEILLGTLLHMKAQHLRIYRMELVDNKKNKTLLFELTL